MPCTLQGGHIIAKCIVLSCTDRGLGKYALRFPNPRHRLARTQLLLSHLVLSTYKYLARKWVRFIQSYMAKNF